MAKERKNKIWSREETIIAFNVYCKIPFKDSKAQHPEVMKHAEIIGRSPDAFNMKIANLGSLDPRLREKNITGLPHRSKMDEQVWNEFHGNWENLIYESERLISEYTAKHTGERIADIAGKYEINLPEGRERERVVRDRVNQGFFRKAILSSYSKKCCITELQVPDLLIASHIIPWSANEQERLNPRNGLCLNSLHDKAFDRGLITVSSDDYRVMLSSEIRHLNASKAVKDFFGKFDGKTIAMPEKFVPEKAFLDHHNNEIFKG